MFQKKKHSLHSRISNRMVIYIRLVPICKVKVKGDVSQSFYRHDHKFCSEQIKCFYIRSITKKNKLSVRFGNYPQPKYLFNFVCIWICGMREDGCGSRLLFIQSLTSAAERSIWAKYRIHITIQIRNEIASRTISRTYHYTTSTSSYKDIGNYIW